MKKVLGHDIYKTAKALWPFNRSITGDGVRMTLAALKKIIPEINKLAKAALEKERKAAIQNNSKSKIKLIFVINLSGT